MMDKVVWEIVPYRKSDQDDSDLPWVTHSGVLKIGDIEIPCCRISTGEALLDADAVARLFGCKNHQEHLEQLRNICEKGQND